MTVPAVTSSRRRHAPPATLPVDSPPAPDAAVQVARLRAALEIPVSAKALRLYTAAVLTLPECVWHSAADLGAAAGFTDHASRPLVGELVAAGLLQSRRMVVRVDDRPVARTRYFVVGTR